MAIFSSKTSYLGIDIGTSSIKIVELANFKGRPRLVTYGFVERNVDGAGSALNDIDGTARTLIEIIKKSRMTSNKAMAALPNFSVFTSILNLPEMPKKELASAISWEAKKIIPMPLEEIILDWKIIKEVEEESAKDGLSGVEAQQTQPLKKIFSKSSKNLRILLTGASKTLVKKYVDVLNKSEINLLSLETENFALIRSLVGNDKSNILLVDLGANTSSITVVENGIPVLTRSLEMGGVMLTRAIANSLNISFERAEQFKQDLSLGMESADNALPQTIERTFASILNEIKYSIELYQDQNKKKIEKVILTGGSSLIGNLPAYLSKILNLNIYVGDPWARVVFPTELKPILDRLGAKFSVAIGLAMRDIE